jgi:NAD(P)-dependent dehydrogenase (short-subunit alcohol dehydrogenase family)
MTAWGTAIVTGAARGLGYEIAAAFRERGYDVLLTDVDGPGVRAAAARRLRRRSGPLR